ncbi:MAG: hypothetical protein IKO06_02320 [Alphaproteobacteria bacterium]|nr:hypothetical protein [Alphaproteobacteria bacterium]
MQQNKYCFSEEEGCKGLYVNENGQCVPDGWEMTDDGYIIIGDNMPDFDMDDALGLSSFTDEEWENLWSKGFICRGDEDKCREILSKYNLEGMTFDLLNDVGLSMAGADSSNCDGFGYSWSNGACTMVPTRPTASSCSGQGMVLQGGKCVSTCGSSFRLNDGECDRIRYTPAEAAQYLKDTDNEIIMTFKVNR